MWKQESLSHIGRKVLGCDIASTGPGLVAFNEDYNNIMLMETVGHHSVRLFLFASIEKLYVILVRVRHVCRLLSCLIYKPTGTVDGMLYQHY